MKNCSKHAVHARKTGNPYEVLTVSLPPSGRYAMPKCMPTPACSFLQDIFPTAKLMQFFVARKYNTANQCC